MNSVGSSVKGYWQVNDCPEDEESLFFWLREIGESAVFIYCSIYKQSMVLH